MWRTILRNGRRAFTLVEVITAVLVTLYVFLGAWSIYVMGWTWWYEVRPKVEAQRAVRLALSTIVNGSRDSTLGSDTVGSMTYQRRNGLAGAMFDGINPTPDTPTISGDNRRIDFRLEGDSADVRAFYYNQADEAAYYVDSASVAHKLDATQGLTDLTFNYYVDAGGTTHYDIIKVTASVSKDVVGTRSQPYHIDITKSDYAYLKNIIL